jgi:hypothetical protein
MVTSLCSVAALRVRQDAVIVRLADVLGVAMDEASQVSHDIRVGWADEDREEAPSSDDRAHLDLDENPDSHQRAAEARRVRCLLRGEFGPFPRRLTRGTLLLCGQRAFWRPARSFNHKTFPLDVTVDAVTSRPADHREPSVKWSGGEQGEFVVPRPIVLNLTTSCGSLDIVLSPRHIAIVESHFRGMTIDPPIRDF